MEIKLTGKQAYAFIEFLDEKNKVLKRELSKVEEKCIDGQYSYDNSIIVRNMTIKFKKIHYNDGIEGEGRCNHCEANKYCTSGRFHCPCNKNQILIIYDINIK